MTRYGFDLNLSPYDQKMAACGQNHNESSFKVDEVRLEIERLKDVVKKWKNKYRILKRTVSNIQREIKTIRGLHT